MTNLHETDRLVDPSMCKLPFQDLIESILFRRSLEKRLEGYTLDTAHEIAETLTAMGGKAEPVGADQHPDDLAVDRFAEAMKAKLAKKRAEGKGGWQDKLDCSREFLSQQLRRHVEKGDPLDVGNLAMMLHQRGQLISDAGAITSWIEREADANMGLPR